MRYLLRMVRLTLLESTGNTDLVKVSSSERTVLSAFTGMLNVANVTSVVQECNKALFHIERNGNSTLILTDLYFKIAGCLTGNRN
jgi:DNA polymerase-3 subunit delta'